jgi:nicotinate-nucleotide--dimethylbenzimidazole phosphoribosyltransferase
VTTILSIDTHAEHATRDRQRQLTKPQGALGDLETLSIKLAGITGRLDWLPKRPTLLICAADHGIVEEGVSAFPQVVTQQMVLNFLGGGAAASVLARQMNAQLRVIDAGVAATFQPHNLLIQRKIANGTANFAKSVAMTEAQAHQALDIGHDIAAQQIAEGMDVLCLGEMGIGNTTSASAIIAAITGYSVASVTGRGTGLDDVGLQHKIEVIERALALHAPANENTLQKVGGFEIGVLAGLVIGAASKRVPIVVDGLITTAAAMIAVQHVLEVKDYLIASHSGAEPGHALALAWLGLTPLLRLNLRLGEGTGALLALPLIEAAMRTLQEMATFGNAGVSNRDA